jgi:hypothetical protein
VRLKRTAIGALSAFALVASSLAFGATSASGAPISVDKVTICHRTNSDSNPYVSITPDVSGVLNGHAKKHDDPFIWGPTLKANHQKWGDIIPDFYYQDSNNVQQHFPGLNMNTMGGPLGLTKGSDVLANGCKFGETPPPGPGSLQVTKALAGGPVTGDSLNGFNIEVTCDDELTDVTLHFTNPPGGAQTVTGIPDGSTCWVVEQGTGSAGFTAAVTYNPTGANNTDTGGVVIASGQTADVTVTNTFKLTSATATQILNSSGSVVTSTPVGSTVHDRAVVDSSPTGGTTPTGTVNFSFYTGTLNCTGTPTTTETSVPLSGGVALSSNTGALAANVSYSYLAHYNGDTTYAASDGPCESLDPTAPNTPVTPVTPATPTVIPLTPAPVVNPATVQVSPATAQVSPATAVQASAVFTG